jgi:K+-transporting ATPase ATPase B chain
VLVALLVCLIPTTIGGLLSAIGISGIDRLIRRNVLAVSGRAVEAAGDVDVLLLDKTGTITLGNRMATAFIPAPNVKPERLADAAQLASLADETPEGRSIVVLAKEKFNLRGREVAQTQAQFVPFTAQTRMSGVNFPALQRRARPQHSQRRGGGHFRLCGPGRRQIPAAVTAAVEEISRSGGTPLVVAEGREVLGVVQLKDVVKGGIKERFAQLRKMGIRTVMITGDNQLTAAAIAAEAGVDDFMAQATPEQKLKRIREEQAAGHLVAMTGDGTNDAPALAQADVGVAMNTGTQAAREAGNMVDLDSNPTKLIEIVEIGKQLLITRGSLTTFSIANDVAKYFAIIPAMLMGAFPAIAPLNVMSLHSPDQRHSERRDFQRPHHHRPHSAGPARRGLQTHRGAGDFAAQPAHLRIGRGDHPVHRHQSHRRHHHRPQNGVNYERILSQLRGAIMSTVMLAVVCCGFIRWWSLAWAGPSPTKPTAVL